MKAGLAIGVEFQLILEKDVRLVNIGSLVKADAPPAQTTAARKWNGFSERNHGKQVQYERGCFFNKFLL